MKRVGLGVALAACAVAEAAEPTVVAPPAKAASAPAVPKPKPALQQPLDLRIGDVRKYMMPNEFREAIGAPDADKNTVAGATVEPLPFHGMDDARYGELAFPESDAHREFVREYLTREGGPDEFRDAVRDGRPDAGGGRRER